MSTMRTGVGAVFTSVPTRPGTTRHVCCPITSGGRPVVYVLGSGRRPRIRILLFGGRRTIPSGRGKGISCLVRRCTGGLVDVVLGTHLGRLIRATGPPCVCTKTSSDGFFITGAGSTFLKVIIYGRSDVRGNVTTVLHRLRHTHRFNFARARCGHTHTRCLHRLRSSCGRHSGRGGRGCMGRCIHRFLSGRPVPNVRGRCAVVGRVTPGVPITTVGRLVGKLVASSGRTLTLFTPRGRSLGLPSRTTVTGLLGSTGARGLATCMSGMSSRPLVTRTPGNNGVISRSGSSVFKAAALALSGKMGIVVGGASFGTSRVQVGNIDLKNDSMFPSSRVVGVGNLSTIKINNLNGFDTMGLRGILTKGGTSIDCSVTGGARDISKDYSPGSFRAVVRLACLAFATPHESSSTFTSCGGHGGTTLGGRRLGPGITFDSSVRTNVCVGRPEVVHVGTSVISRVSCSGVLSVCRSHFGSTDSFAFVFINGMSMRGVGPMVTRCLNTLPTIGHGRAFGSGGVRVHRNVCGGRFAGRRRAPGTSIFTFCGKSYGCSLEGGLLLDVADRVLSLICARGMHRSRKNACNMCMNKALRGCPGRGTVLRVVFSATPRGGRGLVGVVFKRVSGVAGANPSRTGLGGIGRCVLGGRARSLGRGDC